MSLVYKVKHNYEFQSNDQTENNYLDAKVLSGFFVKPNSES